MNNCADKGLIFRHAAEGDAEVVSALLFQLGYSVSPEEVLMRIKGIRNADGDVFVAVLGDGKVVGCVQVKKELRLAEGMFAELVSLVVDEGCRNTGVGKKLIRLVEKWCHEQSLGCLRIRCNSERAGALQFYAKAGFSQSKEQSVLEKYFSL